MREILLDVAACAAASDRRQADTVVHRTVGSKVGMEKGGGSRPGVTRDGCFDNLVDPGRRLDGLAIDQRT